MPQGTRIEHDLLGRREVPAKAYYGVHTLLAIATAGSHETLGDWLYHVGVPSKNEIAGGIVAASHRKGALGRFAPALDG